jgi:hypothetical protein
MKGGIKVPLKPYLSSSAGAFERRGNPWVTDKEGCKDFNRNREVENPDMDADRQRTEARRHREKLYVRGDYKTTTPMDTANAQFDSYFAKRVGDRRNKIDWKGARKGVDFQVDDLAARRRRLASLSRTISMQSSIPESQTARVHDVNRISCPRAFGDVPEGHKRCSFSSTDSRLVARHVRLHANGCCTHPIGCNCPDCRRARNDF